MRTLWKTLIAAGTFAAIAATAPAAQADTTQSMSPAGLSEAAAVCPLTVDGYTVSVKCGDPLALGLDYDGNGVADEWFAVRSDRVVIHIWSGSGGWRPLANGRADSMYDAYFDPSTGYRLVKVQVNGSGTWCTSYQPGRDWYNFWKC
jgi:hypothetical protein